MCSDGTQTFLAHPPTVLLLSQGNPHTSTSPIYGVPHTGVNVPGGPSYGLHTGRASDDLTASHPTSDTICSEGREQSPHPSTGSKLAL